ncbi:uncharacterized protein LOC120078683 [Benincasa hispida]|uniref:uncharacterized protein LOC120078683 n=1 Tax=Benincasa hispida TaxID=102211 RepID=UPI001902B67F|nr:uncharacterized protein LOC120078683 [Benincasa hispida]
MAGEKKKPSRIAPIALEPEIALTREETEEKEVMEPEIASTSEPKKQGTLHINIPFTKAIEEMLAYAKFLKDMSAKSIIPPKMHDSGSFTIPFSIGGLYIGQALCDLGANINLMPLSIFKQLNVGQLAPTTVTLQLTNRSLVHPEEKVRNVLVTIEKFILPTNFIIMDYETDKDVPIILGRPFLSTDRAQIDVHKGDITLSVNGQKLRFDII